MKKIIDMSPEEVKANLKRIDQEIKVVMKDIIKTMKEQYQFYSEESKRLVNKILKI